jgi:hypothetical protein
MASAVNFRNLPTYTYNTVLYNKVQQHIQQKVGYNISNLKLYILVKVQKKWILATACFSQEKGKENIIMRMMHGYAS